MVEMRMVSGGCGGCGGEGVILFRIFLRPLKRPSPSRHPFIPLSILFLGSKLVATAIAI